MNREILFRAKRPDTGEWVEGNLFRPDKVPRQGVPTEILVGTNIVRISYEVDPSTIGQFIGIRDKNGKKVFEGDIVKHFNRLDDDAAYDIGLIFFDSAQCRFKRTAAPGEAYLGEHCRYEIIGNIYDDPELLDERTGT